MGRHQPARQTTGAWTGEQYGYKLVGYHAPDTVPHTSQHVCAHSIMRSWLIALILTLTVTDLDHTFYGYVILFMGEVSGDSLLTPLAVS